MAEEGVVAVPETHVPSDHKRKLEDLEAEAPEQVKSSSKEPADSNAKLDADKNDGIVSFDESDAKRLRLDDNPSSEEPVDSNVERDASKNDDMVATDGLANGNGRQEEKEDEHVKENDAQEALETKSLDEAQNQQDEAQHQQDEHRVNYEQPSADNEEICGSQELSVENCVLDKSGGDTNEKTHLPSDEGSQQSSLNNAQQGDDVSVKEQHPTSTNPTSRKMEVPNNKVGVLIGKAGDTIRYLQYNSGAKIQITRDADSDPLSATRPVEIIGTLDSISIAEKLISAVIAEADAGGSPSLVARGVNSAQAASTGDQIQIQVPNEKVGLIIGRGGETIKALQTRSGARIQLIPQHPPEGDESKERTVRVTGDRKQIETAREMIKDVMNQTLRPSPVSGGFNQPTYRSRVPAGPPQWGNRGHHMSQQTSYDYHQRGAYPSQSSQYPHYGGYHQNMGPRGGFGSGWEQRPSPSMQGIPPHGGGYDYYSGHGGRLPEGPASSQHSAPAHGHVPGPSPAAPAMGPPPSQANYNYGHSQGPDYGHTAAPYSQSGHSQQNYGHGYDEPKYDNHAPAQHPPYGGHGGGYSQAGAQSGYGPQSQYGRPPSYGMPSQGLPSQSYGAPRPNQPGDASYQGSGATQSYGQNVPPQQPYPYASSAPAQQTYPPYGSAPTAEGYNQPTQAPVSGYPQQGGQPVASYNQSVSQQAPGYAQANATAGYAQYPSTQQGYPDQSAANAAAYGYQVQQDPNYSGTPASAYTAPPTGQQGYVQPSAQSYDQSGTYGVPTSASVGYGKTVSPQPGYAQYDSTQMYAAPAPAPAQAPATH